MQRKLYVMTMRKTKELQLSEQKLRTIYKHKWLQCILFLICSLLSSFLLDLYFCHFVVVVVAVLLFPLLVAIACLCFFVALLLLLPHHYSVIIIHLCTLCTCSFHPFFFQCAQTFCTIATANRHFILSSVSSSSSSSLFTIENVFVLLFECDTHEMCEC